MSTIAFNPVSGFPFENSEYFHSGDYDLHYRIDEAKGKEKAKMFLIHGFACSTALFDELVAIYTKAGIKCVRVDLPDFGYSTRERKGIHYVPQEELLEELMDKLDTDGTGWVLLGHSMGGSVAMQLCVRGKAKINALILNTPMVMFDVPEAAEKFFTFKPLNAFVDKVFGAACNINTIWKIAIFFMTFDPIYTFRFDGNRFGGPFHLKYSGTGMYYMTAKTRKPDLHLLKELDIPVQLITGTLDTFNAMPKKKRELHEALPDHYDHHNLVFGGHCLMQNHAGKTAKYGLKFLKDNKVI